MSHIICIHNYTQSYLYYIVRIGLPMVRPVMSLPPSPGWRVAAADEAAKQRQHGVLL